MVREQISLRSLLFSTYRFSTLVPGLFRKKTFVSTHLASMLCNALLCLAPDFLFVSPFPSYFVNGGASLTQKVQKFLVFCFYSFFLQVLVFLRRLPSHIPHSLLHVFIVQKWARKEERKIGSADEFVHFECRSHCLLATASKVSMKNNKYPISILALTTDSIYLDDKSSSVQDHSLRCSIHSLSLSPPLSVFSAPLISPLSLSSHHLRRSAWVFSSFPRDLHTQSSHYPFSLSLLLIS